MHQLRNRFARGWLNTRLVAGSKALADDKIRNLAEELEFAKWYTIEPKPELSYTDLGKMTMNELRQFALVRR